MDLGIKGRVALITGAAGGIGLATAKQLSEEGVLPVLSDIDQQKAEQAYAESHIGRICVAGDMTQQDQVDAIIAQGR